MRRRVFPFLAAVLFATAAWAQGSEWQIDPAHTTVGFTVRHMGISNVHGRFTKVSGTANIDDSGIRNAHGRITLPNHIPFATPTSGPNIIFTSRWDNYPASMSIPLHGHASHAWFLMAGSTNPMQSRIPNGRIVISYTDHSTDTLELINPSTWWPIEEDYYEAPPAFTTGAPHPFRVYLKSGLISNVPQKWTSIKGLTNTAIDGGAATVLEMPLDEHKTLDHLVVSTVARDVVVGLMSITLNTSQP